MAITLRSVKGAPLTQAEMDANFDELDKKPNGQVYPKASGIGIQIDNDAPDWGWHDTHLFQRFDTAYPLQAKTGAYRGGVRALQFAVNEEIQGEFHIPHDYAPGTELFIHAHWSHNGALVTGGSVTWGFEISYAKGYDQAEFQAPIFSNVGQGEGGQYRHMIAETQLTTPGGSGTQLDTALIEVDAVLLCRVYLVANNLTVSGGAVPDPFLHFVDLHYQSNALPTKDKNFPFYT